MVAEGWVGMEQAQFEALIERMERFAIERPAAYRRRVYGLAALGYGYLFLWFWCSWRCRRSPS